MIKTNVKQLSIYKNILKKSGLLIYILIFFSLVLFTRCDEHRVYEDIVSIENACLHQDSLLIFKPFIEDTVNAHDMYISIRHDGAYAYQNIIFFIEVTSPLGMTLKDTLNYDLADDKGKWKVRRSAGLYHQYLLYKRNIRFPVSGIYIIQVRHGMRTECLKYTYNMGLRIEQN
jgi:gliding motility-associated lipoprotein GldH